MFESEQTSQEWWDQAIKVRHSVVCRHCTAGMFVRTWHRLVNYNCAKSLKGFRNACSWNLCCIALYFHQLSSSWPLYKGSNAGTWWRPWMPQWRICCLLLFYWMSLWANNRVPRCHHILQPRSNVTCNGPMRHIIHDLPWSESMVCNHASCIL